MFIKLFWRQQKAKEIELEISELISKLKRINYQLENQDEIDFVNYVKEEGKQVHQQIWKKNTLIYEFNEENGHFNLTGTPKIIKKAWETLRKFIDENLIVRTLDLTEFDVSDEQISEFTETFNSSNDNVFCRLEVQFM